MEYVYLCVQFSANLCGNEVWYGSEYENWADAVEGDNVTKHDTFKQGAIVDRLNTFSSTGVIDTIRFWSGSTSTDRVYKGSRSLRVSEMSQSFCL